MQTNHQSLKIKVHNFYKMKDILIDFIPAVVQLGHSRMLNPAIHEVFLERKKPDSTQDYLLLY